LCATIAIIPTMWLIISAATAWQMGLFQGVVSLFVWLLCVLFMLIIQNKKMRQATIRFQLRIIFKISRLLSHILAVVIF
jgi:hypothetical protein